MLYQTSSHSILFTNPPPPPLPPLYVLALGARLSPHSGRSERVVPYFPAHLGPSTTTTTTTTAKERDGQSITIITALTIITLIIVIDGGGEEKRANIDTVARASTVQINK